MSKRDWDDYPYADEIDSRDWEEIEAENHRKHVTHLNSLSNEDLGKAYQRESNRHDAAVDRCEQINSPTIEDAAAWMKTIERIFKERGANMYDFIFEETNGN